MKTRYWLLPLLFLFVLLPACQKDSDLTLPQPADQSKIEKRQTGRANWTPIGPCEAHQLVVFIPANCIGTDWEQGIQDAVAAYNVTPTSLHFEVTFTHPEIADIIFDCEDFADNMTYGLGEWPDQNSEVGTTIFLNSGALVDRNGTACPPLDCFFMVVVMHEMGHNLGYGHNQDGLGNWLIGPHVFNLDGTFTLSINTGDGMHIPNTAPLFQADPTSILNRGIDCANPNCAFNANDITALQFFYPAVTIQGPDDLCQGSIANYCLGGDQPCVEFTATTLGANVIPLCGFTKTVFVHPNSPCQAPSVPPMEFDNICLEDGTVCYDFGSFDCLSSIGAISSTPKLLVEVHGTIMCLTALSHVFQHVTLTVTPIGFCGNGSPQVWNITLNDPNECGRPRLVEENQAIALPSINK